MRCHILELSSHTTFMGSIGTFSFPLKLPFQATEQFDKAHPAQSTAPVQTGKPSEGYLCSIKSSSAIVWYLKRSSLYVSTIVIVNSFMHFMHEGSDMRN